MRFFCFIAAAISFTLAIINLFVIDDKTFGGIDLAIGLALSAHYRIKELEK